jgi:hypothetical protein
MEGPVLKVLAHRGIFLVGGILAIAAILIFGGCTSIPPSVECKGKGAVRVNGNILAYSGQQTIEADCGDGFYFRYNSVPGTLPDANGNPANK